MRRPAFTAGVLATMHKQAALGDAWLGSTFARHSLPKALAITAGGYGLYRLARHLTENRNKTK